MNRQFFLSSPPSSSDDAFYIAANGDSGNSGRLPSSPKPISDINSLIAPNTVIRINRGDEFLVDSKIDVNASNVTIEDYGTGAKPLLRFATDISGLTWSDEGGGVYSTVTVEPSWVYLNGSVMTATTTAFIDLTGGSGNTVTLNHADVSGFTTIVGARAYIKELGWRMGREYKVTAYDGAGTITLDKDITVGSITSGSGILLVGLQEFGLTGNRWAYESGTLYVNTGTDPSGLDIKIPSDDYGVDISAADAFISNLDVRNANKYQIRVNGEAANISNCELSHARGMGVGVTGSVINAITINGNIVHDLGWSGIETFLTITPVIINNVIYNINMQVNYQANLEDNTVHGYVTGNAINLVARDTDTIPTNAIIAGNRFSNIAAIGIRLTRGTNCTVLNNSGNGCMKRFTDGGGLYVFGGTGNVSIGNTFQNNIVYDVQGNTEGTNAELIAPVLYIDNGALDTQVINNVLYNGQRIILANSSTNSHNFSGNIFKDAKVDFRTGGSPLQTDLDFNDNQLATAVLTFSLGLTNPFPPTGTSDDNYYLTTGTGTYNTDGGPNETLSQLQADTSTNANSIEQLSLNSITLYTNESSTDTTIVAPAGSKDKDGTDVSGQTLTVPAHYGLLLYT